VSTAKSKMQWEFEEERNLLLRREVVLGVAIGGIQVKVDPLHPYLL
jgi:hypothetical protein